MSDFKMPAGSEIGRRSLEGATIQNKFIEHGAHCDNMPAGGVCSLTGVQRKRLIDAYQQNVLAAHAEFAVAITELHLEALMEKPEDLPLAISLALDGLAMFVGAAASKAIKMLRTAPPSTLTALDIMAGDTEKQSQIMDTVRGVDPTWLASMGISQGKKAAAGSLAAPTEGAQQKIDYLGALSDASTIAFEHQRQDPPGFASDAEMIVLFHTWSAAMGNTKNQYKTMLAGKLTRWAASGASKVGRKFMKDADDRNVVRDTQLVALMPQSDEGEPEMWLYKRDYKKAWFNEDDMAHPQTNRHEDDAHDSSFVRWKKVEPEFLSEAMLANQAAWGVPYEKRYDVTDYMQFTRTK